MTQRDIARQFDEPRCSRDKLHTGDIFAMWTIVIFLVLGFIVLCYYRYNQ